MEICCEKEFEGNDFLSPKQLTLFYEKMKQVVVLFENVLEQDENVLEQVGGTKYCFESMVGDPVQEAHIGGGFIISCEGHILTCAHIFPSKVGMKVVVGVRLESEVDFAEADLVHICEENDVAIVKLRGESKEERWGFAKFADDERIEIGMEAISICHPHYLFYSLVVGQVAHRCRLVSSIVASKDVDLHDLNGDLTCVQLNNFHGSKGASGAPVFNSRGQIIGMMAFILNHFDFAINSRFLKHYWEDFLKSKGETKSINQDTKKGKKKKNLRTSIIKTSSFLHKLGQTALRKRSSSKWKKKMNSKT